MSEQVDIIVNQESRGNALSEAEQRMQQLRTRIDEINRLQANYAQKGITGTADLTQERTALQRELSGLERQQRDAARQADREASAAVRDRRDGERQITAEHREQEAVARNRRQLLGRVAGEAASSAGVPGVGMMSGGLPAFLALLAGGIIGKTVSDEVAPADFARAQQGEATGQFNRARINRGRTDPLRAESEAAAEALENRNALEAAKARRGTFADSGIMDLILVGANSIYGTSFETSGARRARENEQEIARRESTQARLDKDASDLFDIGTGGAELEMKRALLGYDMQGVRAQQDKVTWLKEYHRVLQATGNDEAKAQEAAGNAVALQQRDRAGQFAGLINARSGAGDIARAASLALSVGGFEALRQDMNRNHSESRLGGLKDHTAP